MEEEGVINLKGGYGIEYGGKVIRRLSHSQLFGCPNGLRIYRYQELFPVRGLYLLDSMKVFILEILCVVQVGVGRELPAPVRGGMKDAAQ